MPEKKLKILNITGWGRSGSTILGSILGEIDGFFYAGEIRNIWNRVLIENRLCGCGVPFKECNVWKSIFFNAFGGIEEIDSQKMRKLLKAYTRTRHIPLVMLPQGKNFFTNNLNEYLMNLKKLFLSIKETTNSNVIVDSSKSTVYSYLLSLIDEVDCYIVHLVRDPRGIAYSRQKKMIQPDKDKILYMEKYNSFQSSLMWNIRNVTSKLLWGRKNLKQKYLMVRYEDFINNPKNIINDILDLIEEKPLKLPFVSDREVELKPNHSVWGNPSRFKTGIVKLKLDEEWKEKLSLKDKLISTVVTLPLLLRYGYTVKH